MSRHHAAILLVLLLGPPTLLHGQDDGPIKMNPELALAVPFAQKGQDVTVKFPILINPATVLTPGMTWRVLYNPPTLDDSENLAIAHSGTLEESYSRSSSTSDSQEEKLPPEIAHELERQRRIVWSVPIHFQLALAQLSTDTLHLIYSTSGNDENLQDERFNFLDGLFLGAPGGSVTVLAVEIGSRAEKAGLKAGDQILGVGGLSVLDLARFSDLYLRAKQSAKDNNATTFPFLVKSPGEAGTHTVNVVMPPTIKSMLMQGF